MSAPLRNKQGCWTCRVRRKKCDGTRPQCSTCESLSITCYGYGVKPDWFDHGEQEKAMVDSFKQVVKRTSRKKKGFKNPASLARIAPKSSNGASSSSSPGSRHDHDAAGDTSLGRNSSVEDGVDTPQDASLPEQQPQNDDENIVLFPISANESASLMHYLDNVFPLQFPMYRPSVTEGGRGWLLAPMLRLKPLFHAALALSSYHRRKVALADSGHGQCQVAALVYQEKHLEICLVEFQQMLREANKSLQILVCPKHGLGIMALVVQLIFFEFFTGQGSEWKIHLRAATNLHQRYFGESLINTSLSERTRAVLQGDDHLFSKDDAPTVMEEIMTFRFFTGAIIWLDIISSITSGTAPRLQPITLSDISLPSSIIKLEEIMGCKNWVMVQIGRIAALHEHRSQALQEGHLVNTAFEEVVSDINREIQSGLTQTALEGLSFSDVNNAFPMPNSMMALNSRTLVTHIFALMASIYLHLVIHDFQNLELVEHTIDTAMGILKTQAPAHLLPSVVCPLYIIGSVARQEEERVFFRRIFSSPPLLEPLYEHRAKVLPALEEIWRRREGGTGFTWGDSLELVPDLIL